MSNSILIADATLYGPMQEVAEKIAATLPLAVHTACAHDVVQ